jgi:hypothetical protein
MAEWQDFEAEEPKISKFNSAFFINKRMNDLWEDAHKHKRVGAYSDWNGDLDAVWCELAGDVKEGDDDDKKYKEINQRLGAVNPVVNWGKTGGFNKQDTATVLKKTKQYQILIEKEIFLRRLQNRQGKGTAYDDYSSDYMDD